MYSFSLLFGLFTTVNVCYFLFVSIQIAFSSLYEVLCPFTRDFDLVRSKLSSLEDFDKTCLEVALHGVNTLVLDEWGNGTPCQVINVMIVQKMKALIVLIFHQ